MLTCLDVWLVTKKIKRNLRELNNLIIAYGESTTEKVKSDSWHFPGTVSDPSDANQRQSEKSQCNIQYGRYIIYPRVACPCHLSSSIYTCGIIYKGESGSSHKFGFVVAPLNLRAIKRPRVYTRPERNVSRIDSTIFSSLFLEGVIYRRALSVFG